MDGFLLPSSEMVNREPENCRWVCAVLRPRKPKERRRSPEGGPEKLLKLSFLFLSCRSFLCFNNNN